jgi:hypothetical protein
MFVPHNYSRSATAVNLLVAIQTSNVISIEKLLGWIIQP